MCIKINVGYFHLLEADRWKNFHLLEDFHLLAVDYNGHSTDLAWCDWYGYLCNTTHVAHALEIHVAPCVPANLYEFGPCCIIWKFTFLFLKAVYNCPWGKNPTSKWPGKETTSPQNNRVQRKQKKSSQLTFLANFIVKIILFADNFSKIGALCYQLLHLALFLGDHF